MLKLKNQYKRQDVFLCTHDAHAQHGHRVSVYHTMHRKGCFPDGCTYFRWKCQQLEHRRKCYRGYRHVGRKCFGCKFFDEEKFTRNLRRSPDIDYAQFLEDLEEFEDWLLDAENREHWCLGVVGSIKPHLTQAWYGGRPGKPVREHTQLSGYLIGFKESFIGRTHFDDPTYARIGRDMQNRLKFRAGDRVEFKATLVVSEGRLLFRSLKQIAWLERGPEQEVWDDSRALVARATGTTLERQADKCVACDQGMLIDVLDRTDAEERFHHRIFCMKGMPSAALCTYNTSCDLYGQTCSNRYYLSTVSHRP